MLRCFALIALPIFSLFALAAESAAAPIEPPPGTSLSRLFSAAQQAA